MSFQYCIQVAIDTQLMSHILCCGVSTHRHAFYIYAIHVVLINYLITHMFSFVVVKHLCVSWSKWNTNVQKEKQTSLWTLVHNCYPIGGKNRLGLTWWTGLVNQTYSLMARVGRPRREAWLQTEPQDKWRQTFPTLNDVRDNFKSHPCIFSR